MMCNRCSGKKVLIIVLTSIATFALPAVCPSFGLVYNNLGGLRPKILLPNLCDPLVPIMEVLRDPFLECSPTHHGIFAWFQYSSAMRKAELRAKTIILFSSKVRDLPWEFCTL